MQQRDAGAEDTVHCTMVKLLKTQLPQSSTSQLPKAVWTLGSLLQRTGSVSVPGEVLVKVDPKAHGAEEYLHFATLM